MILITAIMTGGNIMLVYLYYPLLLLLLFFGARVCKKGEWNEDVLSFGTTKAFLGFCSIIIIFHHCSQRLCAPWLAPFRIVHGLDAFVFVGYLCVAVFFFCSGYGMFTASKSKEGFWNKFFVKRILPVIIPATIIWLVFFVIEKYKKVHIEKPLWINTYDYIWYIPALICMYLVFYLSFRIIKNEKAGIAVLIAGVVLYSVVCFLFSPGTWWYNTHHLFAAGVITARKKDKIISGLKKGYVPLIVIMTVITALAFAWASYYYQLITAMGGQYNDLAHGITELFGQKISALTFVILVVLIGMKIKIGNKVLSFLGTITLEIYLVHPLFVQLFGFAFVNESGKPLYHIQNQFLYLAAVILPAIPIAWFLHKGVSFICGKKR